jgi:hypothetical protein
LVSEEERPGGDGGCDIVLTAAIEIRTDEKEASDSEDCQSTIESKSNRVSFACLSERAHLLAFVSSEKCASVQRRTYYAVSIDRWTIRRVVSIDSLNELVEEIDSITCYQSMYRLTDRLMTFGTLAASLLVSFRRLKLRTNNRD